MNNFLNKKFSTATAWFGLVILAVTLVSSCKENTILPDDLVPAVDNINTFRTDTFTVISHNIYKDTFLTGGVLGTTNRGGDADFSHAIGTINDLIFGRTVSSLYVQVRQPATAFSFSGTNQIVDSVVLGINYLKAFGDTIMAPNQTFSLYRAQKNFSRDSTYYEFTKPDVLTFLKSNNINFNTLYKDSPLVNGIRLRPQIRFSLAGSSAFPTNLISQTSTGNFATYATFLDWLGGFYIAPDSANGETLGYFDTDNTTMYVYYRFDQNGSQDTATAVFPFDAIHCSRFNYFTRNYTGSTAATYLNTNAPTGDSLLFVEHEPGLSALLTFPYIGQFPNAVINKAELSLTIISLTNYTDTTDFSMPSQVQIVYVNQFGQNEVLEDYLLLGIQRVGGFRGLFDLLGVQRLRYTFNVSNSIQKAVSTQNSNFGFKVSGSRSDFPGFGRVMMRGSGSGIISEKPRLDIIFTKIQR